MGGAIQCNRVDFVTVTCACVYSHTKTAMEQSSLVNSFLTKRLLHDANKLGERAELFVLERIIRVLIFCTKHFSCTAGDDSSTNVDESQHFFDQIHCILTVACIIR